MFQILVFLIVFMAVSLLVQAVSDHKHGARYGAAEYARYGIFYFLAYYFVLSVIKYAVGSWEDTLFESFWDRGHSTFFHYGIVMTVVSVIFPIALHLILKKKASKLVQIFNVYSMAVLLVLLLCKGSISNKVFVVQYLIGAAISLALAFYIKNELVYLKRESVKIFAAQFLPIAVCWAVMNGIFLPSELFINNAQEFRNPFGSFFLALILGAAVVSVTVFILAAICFPVKVLRIFSSFLFSVTLLNYMQYMFFNGKLNMLDGTEQSWKLHTQVLNVAVWLVIIAAAVLLRIYKDNIVKVYRAVCVYICLIQLATLIYMFATTEISSAPYEAGFTNEHALEVADGKNTLVFVLDNFDNEWLQELMAQEKDFLQPLSDFTCYSDITSPFAHTGTGIPYLLTGVEWREEMGTEYAANAYKESNLLADIKKCNYDIGMYTAAYYVSSAEYGNFSNYSEKIRRRTNIYETIVNMWRCSFYQTLPFVVKGSYTYYSDAINEMASVDNMWNIDNDLPFYKSLVEKGLSVNADFENAYRFYHMRGAHAPYCLSEDLKYNRTGREVSLNSQAKGCLKIVYEYLGQLKALGKYDDATIIITSDHGKPITYHADTGTIENTSMPILLVKNAGQTGDTMEIVNKPVTQAGIAPTVIKAAGGISAAYGKTYDEMGAQENQIRNYVDIYKNYIIQYSIEGNANDLNNWHVKEAVYY